MIRLTRVLLPVATVFVIAVGPGVAGADTVVQVPLPGLLDGRSVTTLTGGQIVVWTVPTDGGNLQNAFATKAVAQMKGAPPENSLPDDGRFAANDRHPEVVLNFSNDASATSPQTHLVPPSGSFSFEVPAATYSKVFLFFNGAAGGTTIMVTFTYADGVSSASATVPDYYADISPTDPLLFNLATNLAKWDKNTAINEANHHNITGVELAPTADKTLTQVKVERGANGNLVFWGATGVATSDIAGAGGAGGAGGVAGTGGVVAAGESGASVGGGGGGGQTAGAPATSAGAGGSSASGGAAGVPSSGGGGFSIAPVAPATDGGCGCRQAATGGATPLALWLVLGALAIARPGTRRESWREGRPRRALA